MNPFAICCAIGCLLLLGCPSRAGAQNLVRDPGFENHLPLPSMGVDNWRDSPNWKNEGFFVQVFDTTYVFNKEERSRGYHAEQPHGGRAVACLPAFLVDSRGSVKGGGFAGYLFQALQKPLDKGQYYRIRLWVKLLDRFKVDRSKDYAYLQHFGVSFGNERPAVTRKAPYPALLHSDAPFLLDSIRFEEWVLVDHVIRPTTDLKYIVIGWFDNPDDPAYRPDTYGAYRNEYLLDDVLVEKIMVPDSMALAKAIEWPYLNPSGKAIVHRPPVPAKTLVQFDFDASVLRPSGRATLDSFIFQLKKTPSGALYEIVGFADSTGTARHNDSLSMARALAVRGYLVAKGGLPAYQFILSARGNQDFVTENQTAKGRGANRRVEIGEAETPLGQRLYHAATQHCLAGEADSAFFWLRAWMKLPAADAILLLYDPDLRPLHADPRWAAVEHFTREAYRRYPRPDPAFQWERLYCLDQLYRSFDQLYYEAKGCTPALLDAVFLANDSLLQLCQDSAFLEMERLLVAQGWPLANEVGSRAAEVPALIVCHSSDTLRMKGYLPIFKNAAADGKLSMEWYARLFDKISMLERKVQRYGTQLCPQEDDPLEYRMCPFEEPDMVNERRASLGLGPVDLYERVHLVHRPSPCK